MTDEQKKLIALISHQRKVLEKLPGDTVEEVTLETLHTSLRKTFKVVHGEKAIQYAYSPSRAVLKRID